MSLRVVSGKLDDMCFESKSDGEEVEKSCAVETGYRKVPPESTSFSETPMQVTVLANDFIAVAEGHHDALPGGCITIVTSPQEELQLLFAAYKLLAAHP